MIQCKHCGSQLNIELERCQACGMENPYFKKHRDDMAAYQEHFQTVEEDVYTQTEKLSKRVVMITVIGVLLLVNVLIFIAGQNSYEICKAFNKMQLNTNYEEHFNQLRAYEEAGDFRGLNDYYTVHNLYYSEKLEEYDTLNWCLSNYEQAIYFASRYIEGKEPLTVDEFGFWADYIKNVYDISTQQEYSNPECFSELHVASMDQMKENMEAVLVMTKLITEEEAVQLHAYEKLEIANLLYGGQGNE